MSDECKHLWEDKNLYRESIGEDQKILHQVCWKCDQHRHLPLSAKALRKRNQDREVPA